MNLPPRFESEYGGRTTAAAKRILVDIGQVLGSFFADQSVVLIGGWAPPLLLPQAPEQHVGSIDVDLALNPDKLRNGRYADIPNALLASRRYEKTDRPFTLSATVDLADGLPAVIANIDFLKPREKARKGRAKLLGGFRAIDATGCAAAFHAPKACRLVGVSMEGVPNVVDIAVTSLEDLLVMKAYAMAGRDKPKDAYDICYCIQHATGGGDDIGRQWKMRQANGDADVANAVVILQRKFASVDSFGPQQVAAFHGTSSRADSELQARTAFELVQSVLSAFGQT